MASDDRGGYQQLQAFQAAARPPMQVSTLVVPSGGHTGGVWRMVLPALFDWFAGWLAAPQISPVPGPVKPIPTHGPVKQGMLPNCEPAPSCTSKPDGARTARSGSLERTQALIRPSPVSLRKNGSPRRPY